MSSTITTPSLVAPFFHAARQVLEQELGLEVRLSPASAQPMSDLSGGDLTVLVAITGDVEGSAFYRYSIPCALGIVSRIIDTPMDEMDDLARSGIAELGNVITGRAGILLAERGWSCTIAPPVVVVGRELKVHAPHLPVWQATAETPYGAVTIDVAVREIRPSSSAPGVLRPERW